MLIILIILILILTQKKHIKITKTKVLVHYDVIFVTFKQKKEITI